MTDDEDVVEQAEDALLDVVNPEDGKALATLDVATGIEKAIRQHTRAELLEDSVKVLKKTLRGGDEDAAMRVALQLVKHLVPKAADIREADEGRWKDAEIVLKDGRPLRRGPVGRRKSTAKAEDVPATV